MFKLNFGNRYVEYIKTEKNSHKKKKKKKLKKLVQFVKWFACRHIADLILELFFFRGSKTSWAYVGELR